jgi:DNA-binding MarR family transcriptional regulator
LKPTPLKSGHVRGVSKALQPDDNTQPGSATMKQSIGDARCARAGDEREAFRHLGEEWRRGNVGRSLLNAFRAFETKVLERLHEAGFTTIRRVHLNLYRNLDFDGTRLTELAARGNITKQSMQDLVDRAAELGYVERRLDPADRRAKMVVFSGTGLLLLEALHGAVETTQMEMAQLIGAEEVALINAALQRYAASSEIE